VNAKQGQSHGAKQDPLRGDKLTVTLIKSVHGQLASIAASVRGLGLRKPHQTVTVANTPENRGMINAASHLLKVHGA
jgi:large subunit ribosomal protein L30